MDTCDANKSVADMKDYQYERNRDYFVVGECVQFLFTSCEGSLNEQVSAANE